YIDPVTKTESLPIPTRPGHRSFRHCRTRRAHAASSFRFIRSPIDDASKSYFDTNTTEHHHFYTEDRHELMDIPPTNVIVGKAPVPPDGYEIARIDVVVRLRRKVDSQPV